MSELTINTTQNVNINFTAATVGERILSFLVDFAIKIAYCLVVYGIFFYWLRLFDKMQQMDTWSRIAIMLLFFMPVMFYSLVLETVFEGQSIGKKLIKIKVVKIDGYQAVSYTHLDVYKRQNFGNA